MTSSSAGALDVEATSGQSAFEKKPRQPISPVGWGVIGVTSATAAWYLWKLYDWLNTWPIELRPEIRAALRSSKTENHEKTEELFSAVYSRVRHFNIPLPLLHTTGLACVYASHLSDKMSAYDRALAVLQTALGDLDAQPSLSDPEKLRRLQILYKMGEYAEAMNDNDDAEKYLERGVTEGLKAVQEVTKAKTTTTTEEKLKEELESIDVLNEELVLPKWLSKVDLGSCMESLGRIYQKQQKPEFAIALYLTAISMLLPPSALGKIPKDVTVRDRCAAGVMMNNVAEAMTSTRPTSDNIHNARLWAIKSANVTEAAITSDDGKKVYSKKFEDLLEDERDLIEQCDVAKVVALFNAGVLSDMFKEPDEARKYLRRSVRYARERGLFELARTAEASLDRVVASS